MSDELAALPSGVSRSDGPSPEEIARLAYEIFCARGAEEGRALDDWLQAEADLRGLRTP